jgi:HAD superfamily hydrolase (TIGR01450 family)
VPDDGSVTWQASTGDLAAEFDLLLLDLDGVVYIGPHAVPHAVESLNRAVGKGLRCSYTTNNAARTPATVAEHLRELGLDARDEEVVTSAQEGAERLAARLTPGSRVLAVGGPGVPAALREAGLEPVDHYDEDVVGVLQGYGPDVGWHQLAEASYAVAAGADWVATNPDLTVPTPRGTAPGNGQLVAVVQRTTGVDPEVTGKPGPGLFDLAVRRAGGGRALVVGDRLDTDIAGGIGARLPSLLVLTGVTGPGELLSARRSERPTYLAQDLRGLWEPQPGVRPNEGWWVSGTARARVSDGHLELPDEPATDRLDQLRAAAAAVWEAVDSGREVDQPAAVDRLGAGDG